MASHETVGRRQKAEGREQGVATSDLRHPTCDLRLPLVSVIMPTYNGERMIGEAIESVLAQDFRDLELIVVDDSSTDGTAAIVHRYTADDPRVRYVLQQPRTGGPGPARNVGLRAARGRYVAFLDHDDLWLPGKLALQAAYLDAHPETALYFTQMYAEEDGRRTVWPWDGLRYSYLELFRGDVIPILTVLVRRECVEAVGGFSDDIAMSEDYDLWLRLGQRYAFHFEPGPTAVWRSVGSNLSQQKVRMRQATLKAVQRVPINGELGVSRWLKRRRIALERYTLARVFAESARYLEAAGELIKVAATDPGVGEDVGGQAGSALSRRLQPYRLLGRCLVGAVTGRRAGVLSEGM